MEEMEKEMDKPPRRCTEPQKTQDSHRLSVKVKCFGVEKMQYVEVLLI